MADVIYREDVRTIIREVGTGVGPAGPGGISAEELDDAVTEVSDAVDAETARAVAAEAGKAAQASVDALTTTVAGKADSSTVTSGLAGKADAAATTTALAGKADAAATTAALALKADTTALTSGLALKANASALTQEISDRQAAVTGEVTARNTAITTAVNNLINSAPGTLDTLGEIATALATDESAIGALTTAVNARALQTDLTTGLAAKADAVATTSALAGKASTAALATETSDRIAGDALKVNTADLNAAIDSRVMPGKTEVMWTEATDFNRFSVVPHSVDTVTAWDTSIVTYGNADAGVGEGGYATRARFQGPAGAGGGNSRIFYLLDSVVCKNCEVRVTAVDHSGTGTNNSQIGIIIGYDAATGKAIVVWHDIFVANPRVWNFGLWRILNPPGSPGAASVTSASGNKNWQFRPVLDPPFRYEILDSWRISNVAYYRLTTRDHGIVVGNSVHVVGTTGLDTFTAGVVTSVNGSIVAFSAAGADSANTGPGYMQQGTDPHPFPISIAVKRQDNWVLGKFWNPSEPEPFWSDQRYVARWSLSFTDPTIGAPPTFGKVGVMIGHMTTGKFAEISNFSVDQQDRKP